MPSSYDRIVLHAVWSTKYRMPLIDVGIETSLHAIMANEFSRYGSQVLEIGGSDDHVHVLFTLPRRVALSQIMATVKGISSKWLSRQGDAYLGFAWQDGYSVFSVDYRDLRRIRHYVRNQRQHHATAGPTDTFIKEHTKILQAYGHGDFTHQYVFPDPPPPPKRSSPLPPAAPEGSLP